MNRENILFSAVGLLLGYVIAFHVVVYVNQNQPALAPGQSAGGAGQGGQAVPTNDVKDRQRLQSAAQQAAQAAREEPDNFDAQLKAAAAALEAEDADRAVEFLTRANQIKPDDFETIVMLGNANFEAKRYEASERWYKEALLKKPDDVNVRSDLALTYFLREPRQVDKSIAEFRRALEYNPQHVQSLHNLTLVFKETGKLSEAEATLARLEKINPQGENLQVLREELEKARNSPKTAGGQGGKPEGRPPTD